MVSELEILTDEERSDVFRTRSLFTEETNILQVSAIILVSLFCSKQTYKLKVTKIQL